MTLCQKRKRHQKNSAIIRSETENFCRIFFHRTNLKNLILSFISYLGKNDVLNSSSERIVCNYDSDPVGL